MIGLDEIYFVVGIMFAAFAINHAARRNGRNRWRSTAFWGCFAVIMLAGSRLPHLVNGVLALALAALAGIGLRPSSTVTNSAPERHASANRLGNRLFVPALMVPLVTLAGTLLMPAGLLGHFQLVEAKQVTLVFLLLGAIIGFGLAIILVRPPRAALVSEGRRLMDALGWAAVLPQMLAALGAVFAAAGVGKVVSQLATEHIPMTLPTVAVVVYTVGMALFTIVTGNAFAAFPLMTAGIGLPIIVGKFGGDPVVMSALGMLSGFCGTLVTPMAANFNIVPVAVLELRHRYAVIAVQAPTALILLIVNTLIMAWFVYRK